jgi:Fe-S cluster biosynthesis and repair protein YggX
LLDAEQHLDAVASFKRAIELNPNISKVYQMMAQALLALGERGTAVATLTEGVKVADRRGDLLPKNEMIARLKDLGAAIPELASSAAPAASVSAGQVMCKRCGQAGPKLDRPPFRNAFGQLILENTCSACWREAIGMGTKVINELRLPMSDPQAQKVWDQHIREFLNLAD